MKIGTMLSHNAERYPERTALIMGDRSLTFTDLDTRSNRLAQALMARGLKPGDRVILYINNSIELVETIAGVWKAGGIAVPITTWLVGRELAFMMSDCQPFAIVYSPVQSEAVDVAMHDQPQVLRIVIGASPDSGQMTFDELLAAGSSAPPSPVPFDADDAIIAYTSGTTGTPKGAILTHSNLVTTQLCSATYWQLSLDDVYLVSTPIAHRVGLSRLVSCFCLGVTLVVMPRFDAVEAVDLISRHQVSVIGTVPTVCRLLLEEIEKTDEPFAHLRFMFATGEAFPIAIKQRLAARLPHLKLISLYALTEGSVPAALLPHEQLTKPASVGRPMPGVEIKLVNEQGEDVPTGTSGEIWLRSGEPGRFMIARAYFNRPEANAEAFTDGWFHTGDVGQFDEEGYLYIVDRVKDMILSGGLNIYSREVEQVIESIPSVREVAVLAGPDDKFGECVVAYVASRPGMSLRVRDVMDHCRQEIASYKKPKHVFIVEQLPRNVNGKVRKDELREQAIRDIAAAYESESTS